MLNRYLEGLVKQAESEETLDRLSIGELAKLAGLKLAAHTCDKCGGSMTKSGDMMKCGCGFTKTALVMPAGIGKAVGAGMNVLKAHPRLATAAGAGLAGAGIGAVAGGPGHRLSGAMTGGALGAAGGAFAPEIGKGVSKLKSMATGAPAAGPKGLLTAPSTTLPKPDIMQGGQKIAASKTAGFHVGEIPEVVGGKLLSVGRTMASHPTATAAGAGSLLGAGVGAASSEKGNRLSGAAKGAVAGGAGGAVGGLAYRHLKAMETLADAAKAHKSTIAPHWGSTEPYMRVKQSGLKQLAPLMEDATDVAIRLTGKSTPHEQPPSHEELQARLNKITGEDHSPQLHLPKTAGLKDVGKKVVEHVKGMKSTYQQARKPKGILSRGGGKGRWAAAMHTAKEYPGTSAAVPSVMLAAGGAAALHHKKKESSIQLVQVGDAVGRLLAKTAAGFNPEEAASVLKSMGRALPTAIGAGTGAVTGGMVGAGVGAARAEKGHRWSGAMRGGLGGAALGGLGGAALGQPEVLSRTIPLNFSPNRVVRTAAKWGPAAGLAGLGAAGGMAAGHAGQKQASASRVLARLGPTMGR
jgi:hypothetical protein